MSNGRPILLRITFHDAGDRRSYERELLDERQRVERERARVQVFARTLQRSLLPPLLSPPEGLDASAHYHPASADDVGGDFYDLFPLAHDKWAFFIGDVSGKGAGAAAVTSLTRYTLAGSGGLRRRPVAVLTEPTHCAEPGVSRYRKPICHSDFRNSHPTRRRSSTSSSPAVGTSPHWCLAQTAAHATPTPSVANPWASPWSRNSLRPAIRLGPGDTLVLYTDGLTEARIGDGAERYDFHGALLEFAAAARAGHRVRDCWGDPVATGQLRLWCGG